MSLAQAAKIMNGELIGANRSFTGVSSDSRTLSAGELFIALSGENYNGHEFIAGALDKGAAGAVVSESMTVDLPRIRVGSTLEGMQRLASGWRSRFNLPVAAITGSNGKTTVKELTGAILGQASDNVLVTQGNLNNHIGVPLTLLKLTTEHDFAVIEMGMNHAGEIALLTGLARPAVALVNNAMPAHVQDLGSVEAVARAKGEIFEGLAEDGVAVLNADDANYGLWKKMAGERRCLDFALQAPAAVTATAEYKPDHSIVSINSPVGAFSCRLNLPGRHNVMNALAAVAVSCALGISPQAMACGIASVYPVRGRLEPVFTPDGVLILNDTYNANPGSVKAGIDVLCGLPGKQKILVAGDMGELGDGAPSLHREIGAYAREKSVDSLIGFGPLMADAVEAFGEGGMHTADLDVVLDNLRSQLDSGTVVLVKGSRSMQMERVIDALQARPRGQRN